MFTFKVRHRHSSAPQVWLFGTILWQHLQIWETVQRHLQKLSGTASCRSVSPPTSTHHRCSQVGRCTAIITPSSACNKGQYIRVIYKLDHRFNIFIQNKIMLKRNGFGLLGFQSGHEDEWQKKGKILRKVELNPGCLLCTPRYPLHSQSQAVSPCNLGKWVKKETQI